MYYTFAQYGPLASAWRRFSPSAGPMRHCHSPAALRHGMPHEPVGILSHASQHSAFVAQSGSVKDSCGKVTCTCPIPAIVTVIVREGSTSTHGSAPANFFGASPMPGLLRRLLLGVFAIVSLGCGGSGNKPIAINQPRYVEPRQLYSSCFDGLDFYTDAPVYVVLPTGSYKISGSVITWNHARDSDPPSLVFTCVSVPPMSTGPIAIIGMCRGRQIDNLPRSNNTTWYVFIEQCTVRELK